MSRKKKKTLVVALFIAVLTLSIGYAAMSASLNIKGTANVSGEKWEVKFVKNESTSTPEGQAVCDIGTIEDTSITDLSARFKLPGDSCTFTVPVENTGTLSASLTEVLSESTTLTFVGSGDTKADDEALLNDYVKYDVSYGSTEINASTIYANIDTLEPGEKETITLKVTFKSEATKVPKSSVTVGGLDRTFVFENRETTSSVPSSEVEDVNRKPNAPELGSGLIPVYYDQTSTTDGVWKVADKTNSDNNWYDYATQKWANAVTVKDSYYTDEVVSGSSNANLESDMQTIVPDYYTDGKNSSPLVIFFRTGNTGGTLSFDYEMIEGDSLTIQLNSSQVGYSTDNTNHHYSTSLSADTPYTLTVTYNGSYNGQRRAIITNIQIPKYVGEIEFLNSTSMGWTQFESYKSQGDAGMYMISFRTGDTGGELSFDYIFPTNGALEIYLNDQIVDVDDYVFTPTHVTKTLKENTAYTIRINNYNNYGSQSIYVYNMKLPLNLNGSVAYPNSWNWKKLENTEIIKYYKNFVASSYKMDPATGKYQLLDFDARSYSYNDVGKYVCSNKSNSCNEKQLHIIQRVENGVIKSISLHEAEEHKDLRNEYKSAKVGTNVPVEAINTMWVWIPRYSYTIKKEAGSTDYFGKGSFGNTTPTRVLPGEIDVKFISKNTTDKGKAQYDDSTPTKEWRTNETFNFGGTPHAGIWVGKFETTGSLSKDTQACTNTKCDTSKVTILPNENSIVNQTVSSFFYMARSMQKNNADTFGISATKGDLHMMKNDEWGAVAYLSQSKYGKYGNTVYTGENKEVYPNDNNITGSSSGKPYDGSSDYKYNDMTNLGSGKGYAGPGASTTGTIYGIYDMSGGKNEYVMGVAEYDEQGNNEHNGQLETYNSGFIGLNAKGESVGTYPMPDQKYYNRYKSGNMERPLDWKGMKTDKACNGGVCYGHGLSELKNPNDEYIYETYTQSGLISWYDDVKYLPRRDLPWYVNGHFANNNIGGIFCTDLYTGEARSYTTTRLSLIL